MGSDIKDYIRTFFVRWSVAMSGPLSVPLACIAYFISNGAAKIGLYVLALLCAVFASFWVWRVERAARVVAEKAAKPRATISPTSTISYPVGKQGGVLRSWGIIVINTSVRNLENCQAILSDTNMEVYNVPVCIPFSLRPKEEILVTVIRIASETSAVIGPWVKQQTGDWIRRSPAILNLRYGGYEVRLLADNMEPCSMRIRLYGNDNNDWAITEI